ncbi:Holliday junction DNA helicase RuvA [Tepidicaulis marinus]|uniref:Holliday junction branch migration complex subunit RuvA n=1 Tax=Tepidicaulis marinus TaxID=1333998 RepID=A0A081BEU8_9HYPH|nr:Holliday junction branch migration protein RuvA [Tepidicaulis marinus]GAK46566.1 Holliday junction DNA helicase RuvA [Tepidicaulis marinus]
MIGKLKGIVDELGEDWLILDVGGVGYLVECSSYTLRRLPAVGEAAALLIHTHVREQEIRLFGFSSEGERDWFRLLQSVQGVGARVALAVIGTLGPQGFQSAVATQDKKAVAQTSGVGPKLAQRIVVELKDKAPAGAFAMAVSEGGAEEVKPTDAEADAISALTNLGYAPAQAAEAVRKARAKLDDEAGPETLIRLGLKELAR